MRLFAAIVPPPSVLDHLEHALDQVIPSRAGQRNPRTPRSTWHVTLAFFGEVPEGDVPRLAADFADLVTEHAPFALELAGAGTFSSRTAWVGVAGALPALKRLAADVRGLWFEPDGDESGQAHRPHLTISRQAARAGLHEPLKALAVYRGPEWTVTTATLFESRLGHGVGGHALYVPVVEAPLGQ
ncbi:MAG: RNA 2',3'-cyclic phosphodiesterase [Propionibacteriaceae bacterium]|nr:RNA 2',3'-cyclic phosphodiesterase [Propionibacteriaceae bacterium]